MHLIALRRFILASLSVALFLSGASAVYACSCGSSTTVFQEYIASDIVVVARVVALNKAQSEEDWRYAGVGGFLTAEAVVERTYKGDVKPGQTIELLQGAGGNCVWEFDDKSLGTVMLFYLERAKKESHDFRTVYRPDQVPLVASECGRSASLEESERDDIKFLKNIEKNLKTTTLSGVVRKWVDTKKLPVGQLTIKVSGKDRTWRIETDGDGYYELRDIPRGSYLLEPEIPAGLTLDGYTYRLDQGSSWSVDSEDDYYKRIRVEIGESGHGGIDIYLLEANKQISSYFRLDRFSLAPLLNETCSRRL